MQFFRFFLIAVSLAFLPATFTYAQDANPPEKAPVDFSSDSMTRDEAAGTITATGRVEMRQAGRLLKADEVTYAIATDEATAKGHVIFQDKTGDIYFANTLSLKDEMKDAVATHMRAELKDGSRFWAEDGHHIQDKSTTMKDAAYTPCEPCKEHPEKPPVWEIRAGEVRHEIDEHKIVYKNATFDVYGTPVIYLPYFSHPDGTIARKSGFLTPDAGYKTRQGLMLTNSYYMALAPDYDATVGVTAMTKQAPLVFGEYRQRFDKAQIKINSSLTSSTRVDDINGVDVIKDEEVRGHLFAKGLWDINQKWRAGLNVEYASDDQYLRQYEFSDLDVLENQLYLERFSGRDYAVGRLLSFQDVRVQTLKTDQPAVLPQIQAGFLGEPGETLGGRWSFDISTLGLFRDGSGQDLNRLTAEAGWQRRLVSDLGLVTKLDLKLRGDTYYINDRDPVSGVPAIDGNGSATRGFAQANMMTSYPLVKNMKNFQIIVEPLAALTVSPNVNSADPEIPNEDSRDVQLDVSNLFEPNRFPGYDRIEDKNHATYGVRTGVYGTEGSKGEVFIGQSYRFDDNNNPFPKGSGLSDQYSDIVGQITANYIGHYSVDYKFDLDGSDYTPRRHEVSAGADFGRLNVSTNFLFVKPIIGTSVTENRKQIQGGMTYEFSDAWRMRSYATEDLGENSGLRNANLGLDYIGQCYNISGTLQRNLTDDSSGVSSTVMMLRLGLKNLGEFSTSGINLDNQASKSTGTASTTTTSP